ncbi:hypothetical protein ACOMHN_010826 [Nucella lapillus]
MEVLGPMKAVEWFSVWDGSVGCVGWKCWVCGMEVLGVWDGSVGRVGWKCWVCEMEVLGVWDGSVGADDGGGVVQRVALCCRCSADSSDSGQPEAPPVLCHDHAALTDPLSIQPLLSISTMDISGHIKL